MTLPSTFPPQSRVWIYQADRPFPEAAVPDIEAELRGFAQSWVSHNNQLRATAKVLHNRFVVLMVDETQSGASGCSIDKSVYFLKQLQAKYDVNLFDRMVFSYEKDGEVVTVPREEFVRRYKQGEINDSTMVFDTLLESKGAFEREWLKPLSESWHRRLV